VNISMKPQQVDKESAWYYESAGSIELILDLSRVSKGSGYRKKSGARFSSAGSDFVHVRIPSRLLLATLERQGRAKPVKKSSRTRK
jgi:hypothetical protein